MRRIRRYRLKRKVKRVIIAVLIFLLMIVVSLISINVFGTSDYQEKMNKRLEEVGKIYYEETFYNRFENNAERNEYLKKFEDLGFKVNLTSIISSYKDSKERDKIVKKFTPKKDSDKCDFDNSFVTIYPKSPYSKSDYKIDVKMECGFSKK